LRDKQLGSPKWIIAFLGNPGDQYRFTRHNAGWLACEAMIFKHKIKINRIKFKSLTGIAELAGEKVLFIKPQTFMNLSGEAVAPAAAFYKIKREHIIVIHDDIALPLGKLRIKRGGSDGGHKGVKSLIESLGGDDFPRIKIGVGSPPVPEFDRIDWVIGKMTSEELKHLDTAAGLAADAAEEIIRSGPDSAMNKYNS